MNVVTGNVMAEYQQILSELCKELASFTKERVEIGEDTELAGHLNLDSLQIMNLLLFIEDHFDISIPVNIIPDVKTVSDLATQIEKLTRQG